MHTVCWSKVGPLTNCSSSAYGRAALILLGVLIGGLGAMDCVAAGWVDQTLEGAFVLVFRLSVDAERWWHGDSAVAHLPAARRALRSRYLTKGPFLGQHFVA
jgi:hypothetical protein